MGLNALPMPKTNPSKTPKAEPFNSVFRRLLLADQEILALKERIRSNPADWDHADPRSLSNWPVWQIASLLEGRYGVGSMWSVLTDRTLKEQATGQSPIGMLRDTSPQARRALLLVASRFEAIAQPLRTGVVAAYGHTNDGALVELSLGVWTNSHFYIDVLTGDLGGFEEGEPSADRPEFVPKWRAIELRGGFDSADRPTRERSRPALQVIKDAAIELGLDKASLDKLGAQHWMREIEKWAKAMGRNRPGERSMSRYFKEVRDGKQ